MSESGRPEKLRAKAHRLLAREDGGSGGHAIRTALVLLIVVSVTTAVLKSVPHIGNEYGGLLDFVLVLTTLGFAVEYLVRIWIAPENPGAASAARERLSYVFSLPGLVDLVAAIPFAMAPHLGLNLDWLDIVPIFKLLRHTAAFQFMVEAVYSERRVLGSAGVLLRPSASRCRDCHADDHAGQLAARPDKGECAACHTVAGWEPSTYADTAHATC